MRNKAPSPSPADVAALLAFLPLFERRGRTFIRQWGGGQALEDGSVHVSYPVYDDDVLRFQEAASRPCWSDTQYDPARAGRMLGDDAALAGATLAEVRSLLTYFVRGERFCDGHMGALLAEGRVALLLRRLREVGGDTGIQSDRRDVSSG